MKSLLDLQQEIRTLENNISHIMESVQNINNDINEMRNTSQDTKIDYEKIELLANHISFGKHPLDKLEEGEACQMYLEMLLNIVRLDLDSESTINRLVFIQWLQQEARIDWSLEDLFMDCYRTTTETFCEFVELLPLKYKESFVVDALIVAGLCGTANAEIYEYIAGLTSVLGIEKDKLWILSTVARVALCQNIRGIEMKDINRFQKCAQSFKYYIKAELLQFNIKNFRQIVVEIPESRFTEFKWKVKQEQKVNKGDVIATNRGRTKEFAAEIKSPVAGTIFQLYYNGINYGVIAHKNDNKDSIKEWVKQGGR